MITQLAFWLNGTLKEKVDFNWSRLSQLPQQEEIETIHHEEVLVPLDAFCLWATATISLIV